ncbi:MAG: nuclear transport factor 2 family protein [Armatimonadetes bacterium]|nr:nuclear transport factor 2 family protein [Armatimonadota bacterium]
MADSRDELLELTQRLLDSISSGDWETYVSLCDPALTCFEPETKGHLVEGMEFHRFYFENTHGKSVRAETMVEPRVDLLGEDAGLVCYVRLVQRKDSDGRDVTDRFQETRVWKKSSAGWKHVHFHRSREV